MNVCFILRVWPFPCVAAWMRQWTKICLRGEKTFHKAVFFSRSAFLWALTLCIHGHGDILHTGWCQVNVPLYSPAFIHFPSADGFIELDNVHCSSQKNPYGNWDHRKNANLYPETAAWTRGGHSYVNASSLRRSSAAQTVTCAQLSAPASAQSYYV